MSRESDIAYELTETSRKLDEVNAALIDIQVAIGSQKDQIQALQEYVGLMEDAMDGADAVYIEEDLEERGTSIEELRKRCGLNKE